jgi:hypothetical protein
VKSCKNQVTTAEFVSVRELADSAEPMDFNVPILPGKPTLR